jgi:hypothetical protein
MITAPCGRTLELNDARSKDALEQLTVEVTERVRSSCLHLSEVELLLLATSMATLELKYLGYASTTLSERKLPLVKKAP